MSFLSSRKLFFLGIFLAAMFHFVPTYLDNRTANSADPNQNECTPGNPNDPLNSDMKFPSDDPVIKLIEFTDQGEFKRRCQFTNLMAELKASENKNRTIILYVHGWKHNSTSPDFEAFTTQIEELSKNCLLYTSPSPRDATLSRMPSSA